MRFFCLFGDNEKILILVFLRGIFVFIVLSVILTLAQSVILQPIIDDYIVPLLKNPDNIEYKIGCIRMIFIL